MKELFFSEKGIYYRTNEFDHNKKTLVFVHGLSGSSSSWTEYERRLGDKYNILNFDMRGHGTSIRMAKYSDYEIKKITEDLHDLVVFLKIEKFIFISHSFGTLVTFEFMKNYGGIVEKVVFLNPDFYPKRRFITHLILPLLYCGRIFDLIHFHQKVGRHVDYYPFFNTYDWDLSRIYVDVRNTTLRAYLYCFLQSEQVNYESFLSQINVPVLVFHGNKDTFFPLSSSIIISEKIKNSKLIIMDGDHFILFKKIDAVVSSIIEFI